MWDEAPQATFACLFAEKEEQGSDVRGGRLPSAPSMNGLCDDAGRGVRGMGLPDSIRKNTKGYIAI